MCVCECVCAYVDLPYSFCHLLVLTTALHRPHPPPLLRKVLNLCVCGWQAVIAVALPSSPSPPSSKAKVPSPNSVDGPPIYGVRDPDVPDSQASSRQDVMDIVHEEMKERHTDGHDGGGSSGNASRNSDRSGVPGNDKEETQQALVRHAFDDPLWALVRCLCGVLMGRWKQASSKGGAPKKAWVLHAMEAVRALTRTLEVLP